MIQSPRQIYIAVDFEFFRRKLIRLTETGSNLFIVRMFVFRSACSW